MPWTEIDGSPVHYTPREGSTATEAEVQEEIRQAINGAAEARVARLKHMPTVGDALRVLTEAHHRLEELGWRNAIYCPKDGTPFHVIEAGSSGVHTAHYEGDWPKGSWWIAEAGDLWPSRPILWRPIPAESGDGVCQGSEADTAQGNPASNEPILSKTSPPNMGGE